MSESLHLPYYDQDLDRTRVNAENDYSEVIEILSDPRLLREAERGNVTLAMIRPEVGPEANMLGLPDTECAVEIEEMITGLGIMSKFSFVFSPLGVREFYRGQPQATMEQAPAKDPTQFDSRWPEFIEFMSSGPTTAILLYSPEGDAIDRWRAHLGHWNIDRFRDPATIRGALGVNLFNNLVHGSDSPTSVIRELGLLCNQLTNER